MMMRGTARLVLGALFVAAVCSHGRVANAEDGAEAADSVEARMAAAAAEDEAGGPAEPAAAVKAPPLPRELCQPRTAAALTVPAAHRCRTDGCASQPYCAQTRR